MYIYVDTDKKFELALPYKEYWEEWQRLASDEETVKPLIETDKLISSRFPTEKDAVAQVFREALTRTLEDDENLDTIHRGSVHAFACHFLRCEICSLGEKECPTYSDMMKRTAGYTLAWVFKIVTEIEDHPLAQAYSYSYDFIVDALMKLNHPSSDAQSIAQLFINTSIYQSVVEHVVALEIIAMRYILWTLYNNLPATDYNSVVKFFEAIDAVNEK